MLNNYCGFTFHSNPQYSYFTLNINGILYFIWCKNCTSYETYNFKFIGKYSGTYNCI